MIKMPATVTESGDIQIHQLEGVRLSLTFQGEDGTPRDMTGTTVSFHVAGGISIVLTPGATADELILVINKGDLDTLAGRMAKFALVDETPVPPNVLWAGEVIVTAFS